MDWKLLARSDRAYVRLSEDRAIHATRFLADATASMAFPEASFAKWRQACAVVEGLAFLAHRAGDPVGVRVVGGTAARGVLAPSTRRDVVEAIGGLLDGVTPGGTAPLAPALGEFPAAGRLVIVSDLLGDAGALRDAAGRWAVAGGDLIVVHVLSRDEWSPPTAGQVVDPEDPSCERDVAAAVLPAYATSLASWVRDEEAGWQKIGAAFHRVVAEDDPVPAIRLLASGGR
jgi:uncharacterized protein (DUF58 family)